MAILPRRSVAAILAASHVGTSTASAVMPVGGVGPLHSQTEVGTFW